MPVVSTGAEFGTKPAVWAARLLLAAAVFLALGYGGFLAAHLPSAPMEQAYQSGAGTAVFALFIAGLRAIAGDGIAAARIVSVIATGVTLSATAWMGRKATGDPLAGTGLALGWVVFPPLTATFAMATPHALIAALTASGVAFAWPRRAATSATAARSRWIGAVLLVLAALLHPAGAAAAVLAVLVVAITQGRVRWSILPPVVAAAVTFAAGRAVPPEDVFVLPPHDGMIYALALPYSLLFTAIVLSWAASLSGSVRDVLGENGIRACAVAGLGLVGTLTAGVTTGYFAAGQLLTAMGFFFAIGLIGALPLVVWIRFAMPKVRNRAAWILFPVIMYSAFWLILGPVKRTTFPYRLINLSPSPPPTLKLGSE